MAKKQEYDVMQDFEDYQKHMYDPGHYVGTGRVPPTVSAPGRAMPMVILWFAAAAFFVVLGVIAVFSDVAFASFGFIESDMVNKVIGVGILALIAAFCVVMACGYLRKVRRYRRQKAQRRKTK